MRISDWSSDVCSSDLNPVCYLVCFPRFGATYMTSIAKLYTRIRLNGRASFKELCRIAEAFGFELKRTNGSHHIFQHPDVDRKSTRLNSSHYCASRMQSSA